MADGDKGASIGFGTAKMYITGVDQTMRIYAITEEQLHNLTVWSYVASVSVAIGGAAISLGVDSFREYRQASRAAEVAADAASAAIGDEALVFAIAFAIVGVPFLVGGIAALVVRHNWTKRIRTAGLDVTTEVMP